MLYEKFGVKEYWIIRPDTKESNGFELRGHQHQTIGTFTGNIESSLLESKFIYQ